MYNFIWININNYSLYYFILYKKLLDWIISMGIFEFGIRIGYFPLLNTSWKYFPEKKDFFLDILCCFGMDSFFLDIYIAEKIVNPNDVLVQKEGYFNLNSPVSSNIINFLVLYDFYCHIFYYYNNSFRI